MTNRIASDANACDLAGANQSAQRCPSILKLLLGAAVLFTAPAIVQGDVRLPHVLGSHMVVQRDAPVSIWGWADPKESIAVELDGNKLEATADDKGNWKVTFPAMSVDAASHQIVVRGKNEIKLNDVVVGEVWVGSGQSNMEMPMTETGDAEAIAAAQHPNIRLFHITKGKASAPATDLDATWRACTPDTVAPFSAPLYFFGKRLEEELKMPIGLINSSWGGSPIEEWTPSDAGTGEMYNAMIAPLHPFAIRGIVWYQGEANAHDNGGSRYASQMEALISGWRKAWQRELPFYFVQIAPWNYSGYHAGEVPLLREAQFKALSIPNTGMVVTTDLLDPAGLESGHPLNKRDVGERLAKWALAKTYGREGLVCSGPLFKSFDIKGSQIRLHFKYAAGLKSADGQPLGEFEVGGVNNHFAPASAQIEGDSVVVHSKMVPAPTQVRFAWRNLANPNLVNGAGLPASPFRTRDWNAPKSN